MNSLGDCPTPTFFANPGQIKRTGPGRRSVRMIVLERDEYKCVFCGETNRSTLTMDHKLPKSKGGKWTVENLQTLCRRCNNAKGDAVEKLERIEP